MGETGKNLLKTSTKINWICPNPFINTLVVISDNDFVWFARYGLAVNARNQLDAEKKTSKNLWYEETIPPDSLFYCLLAERGANALASVTSLFKDRPYLQAGGNETVGQGWFAVAFPTSNGGAK